MKKDKKTEKNELSKNERKYKNKNKDKEEGTG